MVKGCKVAGRGQGAEARGLERDFFGPAPHWGLSMEAKLGRPLVGFYGTGSS